jgi:hypothetical protein
VHVVPPSRLSQCFDDVLRRPGLGVPASEVDQRRAGRSVPRDVHEQRTEVLLGKPIDPPGPRHDADAYT